MARTPTGLPRSLPPLESDTRYSQGTSVSREMTKTPSMCSTIQPRSLDDQTAIQAAVDGLK